MFSGNEKVPVPSTPRQIEPIAQETSLSPHIRDEARVLEIPYKPNYRDES